MDSTYGDGIQILNIQTGVIKNYSISNGLDENSIYSIFKDSQGQIWTGSMNGICQYDAQKQRFTPIKYLEALVIEIAEDAKLQLKEKDYSDTLHKRIRNGKIWSGKRFQ